MKTSPRRQATSRPRKTPTPAAPPGLAAAFRLILMDGFVPSAAPRAAAGVYPSAQRVIAYLNAERTDPHKHNDLLIEEELEAANRIMHPPIDDDDPTDPADNPKTMAVAGFQVGFAVCWLLMMALNGKDGAR